MLLRCWNRRSHGVDLRYLHPGRGLISILDPTYDALDREQDFFLAFVAGTAIRDDWRARALESWRSQPCP